MIFFIFVSFIWPTPTEQQKEKIKKTAQAILDARANHPEASLADLYDPLTMPEDLQKAHKANDKAVMEAYGMWGTIKTESECISQLMNMYQDLTKEK